MKQKSIKLNFIMNVILTMSQFIFPLITFPYVSRVLLDVGTGKVSFATSVIAYFNMFAQLGIPTYGIRATARVRDNKEELSRVTRELLIINLVMSAVSYAFLALGMAVVPKLQEEKTLTVITSLTIILSAIGIEWLYKGLEQYTYITVRSVIFKALSVIAMFLLVRAEQDYIMYGAICVFAAYVPMILNLINARRYISFKKTGKYNFRRHIKPVLVFFAMACATTVYTNLDVVMLGFMKTDSDVGLYHAAVRIKSILVSIVTSLGAVLLPRASYYIEQGMEDEFRNIAKKALNFVFLAACPLTLYFIFFAKEGVMLLAGEAFYGAIWPMQLIMPTLIFIGITNILGVQILVPTGRENIVLYSEITGAVVDIVLNALLIPSMGAAGAAIGTLVAEFAVLVFQYAALRKKMKDAFLEVSYLKILAGLVLGSASCFWVKYLGLGNFISLLISAALFFMVYGAVLYITREKLTREIVSGLLKKIRRV